MVAHACNPGLWSLRQEDYSEFVVSLGYRDPLSENKQKLVNTEDFRYTDRQIDRQIER